VHLVVHAGTHKTASTYFQHVLVLNERQLAERGIYTRPDAKMTGNHGTAWMTLLEDYRHVAAHVQEAARMNLKAALLSSEDFETLIFDPRRARLVEESAREAGATSIEWAFCLRAPGAYFSSLAAQLSKMAFVDYVGALGTALRDGRVRVFREARRYPLYWDFCFDYERHLSAFAAAVAGKVSFHDFDDREPFPAHRILANLGVDPRSLEIPGSASRNQRLEPEVAEDNRVAVLSGILEAAGVSGSAVASFGDYMRVPAELQDEAAAALDRRFGDGLRRLLTRI